LKHGSDDVNNLTTTLAASAQCEHNSYSRVIRRLDVAAFGAAGTRAGRAVNAFPF
jgi:hypothetical protein